MGDVRRLFLLSVFALAFIGLPAYGQSVDVGGRAYVDYFYNFARQSSGLSLDSLENASSGDTEGVHGFRYRRLYLTTDFTLSEEFSGRARLEADEGTEGVPVVKDLSLTWAYAGDHSATVGITPPPAFGLVEDVWGYRSLEKTILDLEDLVSSRDFGLRVDGPITGDGTLRYAAMIANNGSVQPETDRYKRVYGQLQLRPSEQFLVVAGADHAGYGDERKAGTRVSTFAGYSTERGRIGIEGYWFRLAMRAADARTDRGVSLFGALQVSSSWEFVARVDRSWEVQGSVDRVKELLLLGVSYRPHPNVALIPNLRVRDSGLRTGTTGRVTLELQF